MHTKHCIAVALILGTALTPTARAETVGDRLQKGVYQEETVGNLEAAINIYQQILADGKANRPHLAQAQFRLGMCYLKKGQKKEAAAAFEKLIKDFPDQSLLIQQSHGLLIALGHAAHSDGTTQDPSRLVCTYPWPFGSEGTLAVSPSGRDFVFSDNHSNLVVRDLKTGDVRKLAQFATPLDSTTSVGSRFYRSGGHSAIISPDGKSVAYKSYHAEDETAELRIISIDGSRQRVVFDPEGKVSWISPMDWSPDGTQIVGRLEQKDLTVGIVMVSVADGTYKELKSLGEGYSSHISISPDGRYIAYDFDVGNSDQGDIALLPVDGSPEISVTQDLSDDSLMGWAPDGRTLLFRSDHKDSGDDVWAVQIIDGQPEGLPQLIKNRMNPTGRVTTGRFTQDGSFYFSSITGRGLHQNVYLATIDPDNHKFITAPKPLPKHANQRAISPEFSPDGKSLAYYVAPMHERSDQGFRYGPGKIIVRSLESGHEREVTISPRYSAGGSLPRLRMHPDGGSALMLGRSEAGQFALFQVDMETGALDPFKLNPGKVDWQLRSYGERVEGDNASWGEYSPDGTVVFFGDVHFNPNAPRGERRTHWRVMKQDLQTGEETEICRNPEGAAGFCNFAISPDGQRLLVGTRNSLWIVPTAGGEPRELLKFQDPQNILKNRKGFSADIRWRVTWTPDSHHLLFLKAGQKSPELWRIAAKGGKPELVDTLPTELGRGSKSSYSTQELRIHPDGQQIAFVVSSLPDQELRVLQNFLPELAVPSVKFPNPPKGNYFITRSEDDAEELGQGLMTLDSGDIDLGEGEEAGVAPTYFVGVRFTNMKIPKGARIQNAYLQFTAEESGNDSAGPSDLEIRAELTDNAAPFTEAQHNISSRKKTKSSVEWVPGPWGIVGERAEKQQTPDLSSIIQEVVAHENWHKGNSLVLIVTGSGERDAISFDGGDGQRNAPMLHIDFK